MNKLLAYLFLAASPLFAVQADDSIMSKDNHLTHYGYFLTETAETLAAFASGTYAAVTWNSTLGITTHEVYLDTSDATSIVLHDKGVYVATFNVTAENTTGANFRFGFLLNGVLISGSVYGAATTGAGVTETLTGQVIFQVTTKNSLLQLVNDTGAIVDLVAIAGPTGEPSNVTASVVVEKLNHL